MELKQIILVAKTVLKDIDVLYHIYSKRDSLNVLTLCPQKFHLLVSFAYSLDPDQAQQNHRTKGRA